MLKKDLILRNPLRLMGHENEDILPPGGFGAVLARAGVGKTALLVQIALNTLLKNNNVLHISLDDPVNKVNLWYEEVFRLLAEKYSVKQMDELWDSLLPNRFIMTFKVEGFSVPKLEERLTDIMEQKIFLPRMIIVDGLPFDDAARESLSDLKALAEQHSLHVWFTAITHRSEEPPAGQLPSPIAGVADLFEDIIQLQPKGKEIRVKALKGGDASADGPGLFLDPSTMLIIDEA
ncbi:MAG: AAA family ATPase [Desulfobacterales bacterium]|nr:AAA family ATPase [Desulfobacterales bacterium]